MKKLIFAVLVGLGLVGIAYAGIDDAVWVAEGTYGSVVKTVVSTASVILSASRSRAAGTCRNNTATTLWIGGSASEATAGNGFPILSSETFTTAAFSGDIYGSCDSGSCDVRCWNGKVN